MPEIDVCFYEDGALMIRTSGLDWTAAAQLGRPTREWSHDELRFKTFTLTDRQLGDVITALQMARPDPPDAEWWIAQIESTMTSAGWRLTVARFPKPPQRGDWYTEEQQIIEAWGPFSEDVAKLERDRIHAELLADDDE